ncbi:MAG: aminotransferase class IV [Pseudomonadota bacterium]
MINVNGCVTKDHEAKISVLDRGFLYGDSVYDVIKGYKNELIMYNEHYKRLVRSATFLGIEMPLNKETLAKEIHKTIETANSELKYIRIIITRGIENEINLYFKKDLKSNFIIIGREFLPFNESLYSEGIGLKTVSVKRTPISSLNPMIKSGNYLNNIMALKEAKEGQAFDSLILNHEGYVTELSSSNIFFVNNSKVCTPSVESGILDGITRGFVIKLCKELDIEIIEAKYKLEEIINSSEVFITSTLKDILPVTSLDDKQINHGKIGPLTKSLINSFNERIYANA